MESARQRPTGVTIVAILNIIGGIIMLVLGLALVVAGAIIPGLPPEAFEQENLSPGDVDISAIPPSLIGGGLAAVGGVMLALAVLSFVVAYGLLKGRSWAWMLTVILAIISIAVNAISIATGNLGGIVSVIISGVILYYLYRPHVKAYFGKGITSPPSSSAA
ncbi:MAG: hypothetical protein AB1351_10550 [Thermoproteota archaeon]